MVRAVGPKAKAATAAMASAFSAGYRGGPPPREGEGVWLRAPPNMSEAAFREALPTLTEIERSQHDNAEYAASSSQERARVAIWAMLAEELLFREQRRGCAQASRDQWSSWTRYGNALRRLRFEEYRKEFGYVENRTPATTPAPKSGAPARGKVPYEQQQQQKR